MSRPRPSQGKSLESAVPILRHLPIKWREKYALVTLTLRAKETRINVVNQRRTVICGIFLTNVLIVRVKSSFSLKKPAAVLCTCACMRILQSVPVREISNFPSDAISHLDEILFVAICYCISFGYNDTPG